MPDFPVSLTLSNGGAGLQLNNRSAGYQLASETKATQNITWRKTEVSNPFVEGTYVTSALKENIVETVAVYCYGTTGAVLRQKVQDLIDAFSQITYTITWTLNGAQERWTCMPADLQIGTQKEFQHAKMALVTASVPRLPTAVLV